MGVDTIRTDKVGFPVQECRRCGGSGHYSYNTVHGSVCYGCSGTGWQYTRKAARHAQAYREAVRRQRDALAQDLQPGDRVVKGLHSQRRKGDQWVTVTEVERTDRESGRSLRDGEMVPTSWYTIITTDDGETRELGGNMLVRRFTSIDPAPFVEASYTRAERKALGL